MPVEKRTYADRRKELIRAVAKRRKTLKTMAIAYKGGKCMICGYCKCRNALELHHVNPADKNFSIGSKGYTRSWQKVKEEIDKCVLLCANCHREVGAGITQLPVERQAEKRGELSRFDVSNRGSCRLTSSGLETLLARSRNKGNQQPSRVM